MEEEGKEKREMEKEGRESTCESKCERNDGKENRRHVREGTMEV